MEKKETDKMMTRNELAEYWNVSGRTIDRMRVNGLLPWVDLSGGHGGKPIVRFALGDILEYEQKFRMTPGQATH